MAVVRREPPFSSSRMDIADNTIWTEDDLRDVNNRIEQRWRDGPDGPIRFAREAIGMHPNNHQEQMLASLGEFVPGGGKFGTSVASSQGCGKCLRSDSRIITDRGLFKIGDLTEQTFGTISLDLDQYKTRWSQAPAFASGHKSCTDVYLANGSVLKTSDDHPVLTTEGWVKAADLKPGDLVSCARTIPEPKDPIEFSDEEVELYAFLAANGGCTTGPIIFTNMLGPALDRFTECVGAMGFEVGFVRNHGRASGYTVKGATRWARAWNLDVLSKNKTIHNNIFRLPTRQVALFVNRFWACDGYFNKSGGNIEVTLASKDFIEDLQMLLLRLSVTSSINHKPSTCQTGTFDAWRLTITGQRDVEQWLQHVGEVLGKESYTDMLKARLEVESNSNRDITPATRVAVQEILDNLGVSAQQLREHYGVRHGEGGRARGWGRNTILRLVNESGYDGELTKWAEGDVHYVSVSRIENVGVHPVYDLTVPGDNNFVTDGGAVVHNTTGAAMAILWFIICFKNSLAHCTAPTERQLHSVLWGELDKQIRGSRFLSMMLEWKATRIGVRGESVNWGAVACTARNVEAIQGKHRDHMLIVVDEASGVDDKFLDALMGGMTQDHNLALMISNPTISYGSFYDSHHKDSHLWNTMSFSARDSVLVPESHIKRMEDKYGVNSPIVRIRVDGKFPEQSTTSLVNIAQLEKSRDRRELEDKASWVMGVDVARYGDDQSSVCIRSGGNVKLIERWHGLSLTESCGRIVDYIKEFPNIRMVNVDEIGLGAGLVDMLFEEQNRGNVPLDVTINGVNVARSALNSESYPRLRDELWFGFAEIINGGGIAFADTVDRDLLDVLIQECAPIEYHFGPDGRRRVDTKDEMKEKIGYSPDIADAAILAFHEEEVGIIGFLEVGLSL